MDANTLQVVVGLRLGTIICLPHVCCHCGHDVNSLGLHGLSCKWSKGRHFRHTELNDVIHCTLFSAQIPSRLEPAGVSCTDGKWPDGITIVPWSCGKLLVWDATCVDTFAPSYLSEATREAGVVAAAAEQHKKFKYSNLAQSHQFTPVVFETSSVMGPGTENFLKGLGSRLK